MQGKTIIALALVFIPPSVGWGQQIGIPQKPTDVIPAGYEQVLQVSAEGDLVWVPRKVEAAEQQLAPPPPPPYDPPIGWRWVPIYNGMNFLNWVLEPALTFWDRYEALIKYVGGIFLAILNVFSFRLGHSKGMTTVQKPDTSPVRSR